jgi:hypothetical protein
MAKLLLSRETAAGFSNRRFSTTFTPPPTLELGRRFHRTAGAEKSPFFAGFIACLSSWVCYRGFVKKPFAATFLGYLCCEAAGIAFIYVEVIADEMLDPLAAFLARLELRGLLERFKDDLSLDPGYIASVAGSAVHWDWNARDVLEICRKGLAGVYPSRAAEVYEKIAWNLDAKLKVQDRQPPVMFYLEALNTHIGPDPYMPGNNFTVYSLFVRIVHAGAPLETIAAPLRAIYTTKRNPEVCLSEISNYVLKELEEAIPDVKTLFTGMQNPKENPWVADFLAGYRNTVGTLAAIKLDA